jgi:type IV secretory pathway VirB10-like protein
MNIVDKEQEESGGFRLNKRVIALVGALAIIVGVAAVAGIHAAGTPAEVAPNPQVADDVTGQAVRDRASTDELYALAALTPTPFVAPSPLIVPQPSQATVPRPQRTPGQYEQWAQDKYMKALEAPQMVGAFHGSNTVQIASNAGQSTNTIPGVSGSPKVSLDPPASPFTVMAGSVIPAVLVSGINSDMPGPILAQVSQNVFDSRAGQRLLIPQGTRLIGISASAGGYGAQRIQIAWQRLIFPDTSSMNLPQMPGADMAGYGGLSDRVDNHLFATFGTAALMSMISAGQQVGQMVAGGSAYGAYGQPNQWAMASQEAGAGASSQFGAVGQQSVSRGMNRPPTIEIRPGYEFNVMVTEDLTFPGPYQEHQ